MSEPALLLDTHVWVWLVTGDVALGTQARRRIEDAASGGQLLVSAISVWEVGMLERKGRLRFAVPVEQWVHAALTLPGITSVQIDAQIALEAAQLPGEFHGDPADRLLVATARRGGMVIATRDEKMMAYSQAGFVRTHAVRP